MIDAISYFTDGGCTPSGEFLGPTYFTNGLLIPESNAAIVSRGGVQGARIHRQKFVNKAKRDAEDIFVLLSIVSIIDEEG